MRKGGRRKPPSDPDRNFVANRNDNKNAQATTKALHKNFGKVTDPQRRITQLTPSSRGQHVTRPRMYPSLLTKKHKSIYCSSPRIHRTKESGRHLLEFQSFLITSSALGRQPQTARAALVGGFLRPLLATRTRSPQAFPSVSWCGQEPSRYLRLSCTSRPSPEQVQVSPSAAKKSISKYTYLLNMDWDHICLNSRGKTCKMCACMLVYHRFFSPTWRFTVYYDWG